jgi:hypothetical protein
MLNILQVVVEASTSSPSGTPASLILRRMKRDSTELTILQSLNHDEICSDPWNPAPNILYKAERGEDAILCFERLFSCDNPPLQTVANVIDYIRQVLEVTCTVLLSRSPPGARGCSCSCTPSPR